MNRWERFAREDPEHYIVTGVVTRDEFDRSGFITAERLLTESGVELTPDSVVLEFGCGAGRVLLPMAEKCGRAIGVDISPTMLKHMLERAEQRELSNVAAALVDEEWSSDGTVTFAYSHLVFQHIADVQLIASALSRIANLLATDGRAHLQFDTRPQSILYAVRNALPDAVLPRDWRRGIRRIRREAPDVRELLSDAGLEVLEEWRPVTGNHGFVVRRRLRPRESSS